MSKWYAAYSLCTIPSASRKKIFGKYCVAHWSPNLNSDIQDWVRAMSDRSLHKLLPQPSTAHGRNTVLYAYIIVYYTRQNYDAVSATREQYNHWTLVMTGIEKYDLKILDVAICVLRHARLCTYFLKKANPVSKDTKIIEGTVIPCDVISKHLCKTEYLSHIPQHFSH